MSTKAQNSQGDNIILLSEQHENIMMDNLELPINFIRHEFNNQGPMCILHWHKEIEIVYVEEGAVRVRCGRDSIEAGPGDLVFINSNELHDYTILSSPLVLLCNTISLSLLQGKFLSSYDSKYLQNEENRTNYSNLIKGDDRIKRKFLDMWDEYNRKEIGYEYSIKSNLYAILTELIRNYTTETISNKEYLLKKRSLHNINKVIKYIDEHYHERLYLEELANLLNINKFYFCRFFKEIMGSTPMDYINTYRVHKAVNLINNRDDMTISEIASAVGYSDSNYFTRVFKSVTQMSPTQCRRDAQSRLTAHS